MYRSFQPNFRRKSSSSRKAPEAVTMAVRNHRG